MYINRDTTHRLPQIFRLANAGLLLFALATVALPARAEETCTFALVKAKIDYILDRDKVRGARFRKEIDEGADSMATLEEMFDEKTAEMMEICRFPAAEYLTKRGFPPKH